MKCGFCAYEFDPVDAEEACTVCPVVSNCHLVRCPRCGYEMPPESTLLKWMRGVEARLHSSTSQFGREDTAPRTIK